MASPLSQGRIVWATIPDPRGGNPKTRPAVVLTATADIAPTGDVQVAAITTMIGQSPFSETVPLPSEPAGHPQTRLKKPSEVVCTWLSSVPVAGVQDSGGFVPQAELAEILLKAGRLH